MVRHYSNLPQIKGHKGTNKELQYINWSQRGNFCEHQDSKVTKGFAVYYIPCRFKSYYCIFIMMKRIISKNFFSKIAGDDFFALKSQEEFLLVVKLPVQEDWT